jgi:hypothetical protein
VGAAHCALPVQDRTQRYLVVSHVSFVPQLPALVHCTQLPVGEQYGVAPPHCASVVH